MTDNQTWMRRSLAAVWHPCTQMKAHESIPLVPIRRGEGPWLYDFEGKRYLDAISSWWVNLFGHCNPRINAALQEQLGRLEHLILAGFTQEPVVRLSERLSALTEHRLGHCFYASDGASATEIALKMSFHFWQNTGRPRKRNFISLQNGYHGETVGALSVTDVALFKEAYAPLLRLAATVPTPDWRLSEAGESSRDFALRRALDLEAYLELHHEDTAAFIFEPLIQCATGMAMYDPAYLQRARQICDRFQVHLIADEIAVGFGRTGSFFAHEQAGIRPDLLCLSKGISGGYLPLSVVLATDDIYQAFYSDDTTRGFLHSHSYTGNALACTAALATLEIFEQDQVLAANRGRAARMTALCEPLRSHPLVEHFRNRGMIWAFDVRNAVPGFARAFFTKALEHGLLLRPIGNTVYFMPPYVIADEEMQALATGALEVLREVTQVA
jgi:adenosylmethionine-8-amino-7-oxononanoate aminotransferase